MLPFCPRQQRMKPVGLDAVLAHDPLGVRQLAQVLILVVAMELIDVVHQLKAGPFALLAYQQLVLLADVDKG